MQFLNKIKQQLFILVAICVLGLSSCGVEEPTLEGISEPEVVGQTDSTVNLKMVATINNPNSFEIPVKSVEYEIEVLGKRIGYGTDTLVNPLNEKASTDITFRPVVDIPEIATMYKDIIGKNEIAINITGNYHLKLMNQPFDIPIEKSTTINIREYLDRYTENTLQSDAFSIKKVYLPEINAQKRTIMIKADVVIKNNLPVKYTLSSLHINAFPLNSGNKVGDWILPKAVDIEAGTSETFTVQYYMNQPSVLNLISDVRENTFRLEGDAEVVVSGGKFSFPVNQRITVPWEDVVKSLTTSAKNIAKKLGGKNNGVSGTLVDSLMNFIEKQKGFNLKDLKDLNLEDIDLKDINLKDLNLEDINLKDIDLQDVLKYLPQKKEKNKKQD